MSWSMIRNGDIRRQAFDRRDDPAGLARGDPSRRLVEQQHLGGEGERHRDLDQPLTPIGERRDRLRRGIGQPHPLDHGKGFLDCGAVIPGRAEQIAGDPLSLADRQGHVFEHAQAAEQRGDLKGADEAALDPRGLRQSGDVGAVEQDLPGIRRQCTGDQIDKAGLAGAVRPDQRMPRTTLQAEVDSICHRQGAEALGQSAGFERRRAHRPGSPRDCNRSAKPSTPPRAKTTSKTINRPIQKYQ